MKPESMRRIRVLAAAVVLGGLAVVNDSSPVGAVHHNAMEVSAAVEPGVTPVGEARTAATGTQTSGPYGFPSPNDVLPWNLDRIDQRAAAPSNSYSWDVDGTGVTVYVLDSGVRKDHPEFEARVAPGWSYRTDEDLMALTSQATDSCKDEPGYDPADHEYDVDAFDFPNPLPTASEDKGWIDNDGHGTHVAGTVGGKDTGVAKGVTIVPVRILSSCGLGDSSWFLAGLDWVLSRHTPGAKSVVNMSVGTRTVDAAVNEKIEDLVDAGIVVVGAAGNGKPPIGGGPNAGQDACSVSPGSATKAIVVGAIMSGDVETSYSNYGPCVDVLAPGSMVASAYPYFPGVNDPYVAMSGTSMAAPAVSGAVALRLQASPGDTPAQVAQWLTSRATGCAVTPHDVSRAVQSPNLLLNVSGPAAVPCPPRTVAAVTGNRKVNVSWFAPVANNGAAVTGYTAVASPGGASCTTTGTSCTISNLVPGTTYTVSVSASNSVGSGQPATATVIAVGSPDAPTRVTARGANGAVRFSWAASAGATSYTVRNVVKGTTCTTSSTTCTIKGVKNGSSFTWELTAVNADGVKSSVVRGSARAGFTIGTTKVAKRSRTTLTSIVTTTSTGAKRWTTRGGCAVSGTRLVAPARRTTCTLTLSVAKRGSFPAMTTSVAVLVS